MRQLENTSTRVAAPGCSLRPNSKGTKQMEVLVFGLLASGALNQKQERIVPEPAEFQSFDLRTLEHWSGTASDFATVAQIGD
jgi:hypothetical protein